jgi:hypothetical protein
MVSIKVKMEEKTIMAWRKTPLLLAERTAPA